MHKWIWLVLGAVAAVAVLALRPHRRPARPAFLPIAQAAQAVPGTQGIGSAVPVWRSGTEVVCIGPYPQLRAWAVDATTGASHPIPISLTLRMQTLATGSGAVAPDGSCFASGSRAGQRGYVLVGWDGEERGSWPMTAEVQLPRAAVMADGRHLVGPTDCYNQHVVVYTAGKAQPTLIPMAGRRNDMSALIPLANNDFVWKDRETYVPGGAIARFTEYSIATPKPVRTHALTLARCSALGELAFSRQGDRAAFFGRATDLLPAPPPISLRPQPAPDTDWGIWIAPLHGRASHRLPIRFPDPSEGGPRRLHWLPDGKRVGFVYKGQVWTMKAD